MERESEHYLIVNAEGARLLKKCVDLYLERWPGGDPTEQETLFKARATLTAVILENTLLK